MNELFGHIVRRELSWRIMKVVSHLILGGSTPIRQSLRIRDLLLEAMSAESPEHN